VHANCAQALDRVRLRIAAAGATAEAGDARMTGEHANNPRMFLRAMSHELRHAAERDFRLHGDLEMEFRSSMRSSARTRPDQAPPRLTSATDQRYPHDARLEGARPLNVISIPVNPMLAEVEGLCGASGEGEWTHRSQSPMRARTSRGSRLPRDSSKSAHLITNAIKFTGTGATLASRAIAMQRGAVRVIG